MPQKMPPFAQPILPGGSFGSVILVVMPRQCRKHKDLIIPPFGWLLQLFIFHNRAPLSNKNPEAWEPKVKVWSIHSSLTRADEPPSPALIAVLIFACILISENELSEIIHSRWLRRRRRLRLAVCPMPAVFRCTRAMFLRTLQVPAPALRKG